MVYHISAQYHAYSSTGALVIEGATSPHTLIPVLAGVLIELMKLCQTGISLDDHHRSLQSLISQHLVSGDSAYVRMSRLALQEGYFRTPLTTETIVAGLQAQTLDDVQIIAQELLSSGLPTVALVGPVVSELLEAVGSMLADFGEPPRTILMPRRTYSLNAV
jgi:predicted Zn-dependent peptidase